LYILSSNLAVSKFKSLINRIFFSLFLLIIYFINLLLKCIINFAWVLIQDPVKLDWQPYVKIEHYQLKTEYLLKGII
ncbi:MAG: hypothetical protein ACK4YS_06040, partial [Aphanizomenon sp.]